MKIGIRKRSYRKSFSARTTGKWKRQIKRSINPLYGKKGMGWINNPRKAMYNKVYNKTTIDSRKVFGAAAGITGLGTGARRSRHRRPAAPRTVTRAAHTYSTSGTAKKHSLFTSLGWILFWMICFFPIGIYSTMKRFRENDSGRVTLAIPGRTYRQVMFIQLIFGGLMFLSAVSNLSKGSSDLGTLLFMLLLGGLLLWFGLRRMRILNQYSAYLDYFTAHTNALIRDIATLFDLPEDQVHEDILFLIRRKVLPATITAQQEIVVNGSAPTVFTMPESDAPVKLTRTDICSHCGAPNTYTVEKGACCAYCGCTLEGSE